jgi:hypothetical protein
MKTVCFLTALTAFGCVVGQRKGVTVAPTMDRSSIHELPTCPEKCNCASLDQNMHGLNKAICPNIPSSLHYSMKSLQVYNMC